MPHVVFVCTGNAARSVMAGAILAAHLDDVEITTAGTHVVEGMPMSWRTREALAGLDVRGARPPQHPAPRRRRRDADLVVGLAGEHVAYVRRTHPEAAARTGTLRRLARDLPGDRPGCSPDRVAALAPRRGDARGLGGRRAIPPAGDLPEFEACAARDPRPAPAAGTHAPAR